MEDIRSFFASPDLVERACYIGAWTIIGCPGCANAYHQTTRRQIIERQGEVVIFRFKNQKGWHEVHVPLGTGIVYFRLPGEHAFTRKKWEGTVYPEEISRVTLNTKTQSGISLEIFSRIAATTKELQSWKSGSSRSLIAQKSGEVVQHVFGFDKTRIIVQHKESEFRTGVFKVKIGDSSSMGHWRHYEGEVKIF